MITITKAIPEGKKLRRVQATPITKTQSKITILFALLVYGYTLGAILIQILSN